MKKTIDHLNRIFGELPERLKKHRWKVITAVFLMTVLLGAGAGRVIIDNSLDSFFKKNDPVKKEYDHFRAVFGGDEYIYIVYKAKDGDIFSDASLGALKGFYDDLNGYRLTMNPSETSPLDHIVEIKSLINIKYLEASADTLFSRSLIGDNLPASETDREVLRQKALNHPDYPYLFLSNDSTYGGILLRTDFNSELIRQEDLSGTPAGDADMDDDFSEDTFELPTEFIPTEPEFKKSELNDYPALMATLREMMQQEKYSSHLEFHPVGTPVMMDFFADAVLNDLGKIMGLVLALITLMLWLLFRSVSAVIWPVVIILTTLVWATGLIGWSGIHMSIMFQIIIFLVLAVGVADSVHIMSGYLFFREKGLPHSDALSNVMKKSGLACFLTSITTSAGLVSLILVPVRPISVFGIFSALGVMIAFLMTVTLMPLLLDFWNPVSGIKRSKNRPKKQHLVQRLLQKTESIGAGKPWIVIPVFTIAGIVLFVGLMQLRIDSDEIEVLKKGLPLRQSYNLVNQVMGGTGNMEISINLKRPDALKDPMVLKKMDQLQQFLIEMEGSKVMKTRSLVNQVKDAYKALNNGDDAFYRIPETREQLTQTLFLFSNANPKDRRRMVTDDYSSARIGINNLNIGSVEALEFQEKVRSYIDKNFQEIQEAYPDAEIILTGNNALLAIMLDYISWSQIKSFGLTLFVISVILFLVFGNIKAGLVAIVPNLFPILTSFGLMGFLGIPLDMDTLLIAPVIIGLAVDDTIHFMTHFRLETEQFSSGYQAAVHSIREAGQAICFTSLILSAGFSMFTLSFHNGFSHFGIFSAIAILTAFIADIFLLPSLCIVAGIQFTKEETAAPEVLKEAA